MSHNISRFFYIKTFFTNKLKNILPAYLVFNHRKLYNKS